MPEDRDAGLAQTSLTTARWLGASLDYAPQPAPLKHSRRAVTTSKRPEQVFCRRNLVQIGSGRNAASVALGWS